MKKLKKPLQYIFEREVEFNLILIGCGGTGSFIAWDIARLMWHMKEDGKSVSALFIDPDTVEEKNVGRQNFAPCDIGKNKADALSTRFNRAYGLEIAYFDGQVQKWEAPLKRHEYTGKITILIGAVDNEQARLGILDLVKKYKEFGRKVFWLDCGNSEDSGQILIGNDLTQDPGFKIAAEVGLCPSIPLPSNLHPELVEKQSALKKYMSCAELTILNSQSLMINRAVATFAAQYLYDALIKRTLKRYATYLSLGGCSSTSKLLTESIWRR